jgi:multidrug efflux pump subunit AcrA (membrane-fusion protein)
MRKIAGVATCAALTVALTECGGMSQEAANGLSAQRAQIAKARATLVDQRAALVADQAALAKRKAHAVGDIKKTRNQLRAQARHLRGSVSQLRSRSDGLRGQVRSESNTLRDLQDRASGARYLVRHSSIPGTGTFLVSKEITPGTYRAGARPGCYWERDSSLDGGFDAIAANDNADGPVIVAISSADAAFKTSGCATFHKVG